MIRNFYDWSLEKSRSAHAQWILFLIAFAESSFFIFPPDIFMTIMVFGHRERWLRYVGIAMVGSVFGGIAGYFIGWGFWEAVKDWFIPMIFSQEIFNKAQELYQQYDFWAIFTAAFTPIPYKVFTITAGVAQINLVTFTIASIIGRGGRFITIAALLYFFGPPIKKFIDKYFGLVTIAFTVLLIGGFFALKYLAH